MSIRAEHDAAVEEFATSVTQLGDRGWQVAPRTGGWTPAAVTLHLCQAYEVGRAAVRDGVGMQLRVAAPIAWLLGRFYLPVILARGRFPHGAVAPVEVRPAIDAASALTIAEGMTRLRSSAAEAAMLLMTAPPSMRIQHAYFGALRPPTALRLLSAHTRHHARLLRTSA